MLEEHACMLRQVARAHNKEPIIMNNMLVKENANIWQTQAPVTKPDGVPSCHPGTLVVCR